MPRLFIGIMLPELLQPELLALLPLHSHMKPARPGQLHLTLHFLGQLDDTQTAALQQALAEIRCDPFTMTLAGTGVFEQDAGRRGVLWVGVRPNDPLARLHAKVTAVLQTQRLPLETRPWSPHITLARYANGPPDDLQRFLRRGLRIAADVTVRDFHLVQSLPGPAGSVYSAIAAFALV